MQEKLSSTPVLKIAIDNQDRLEVIHLLRQHHLPVSDIDENKRLFILKDSEKTIGTGGLEIFQEEALLRSVSVAKDEQKKGFGKIIHTAIENYAIRNNITCLYLLTTTARNFFEQLGYEVINRNDSPATIKDTVEFGSLCPSSAVVMKKKL